MQIKKKKKKKIREDKQVQNYARFFLDTNLDSICIADDKANSAMKKISYDVIRKRRINNLNVL